MNRYKVVLAMRSNAFPHVDTLATYRIVAANPSKAINAALMTANREGIATSSGREVRRITITTVHSVTP